jgi:cytochrome P450
MNLLTGIVVGSYPSTRFPGVLRPARGTFLPWSEGFRACLGRRFAEVEMAVMLAVLFSRHRCEVARLPGESETAAKQRAQGALDRATMQISLGVREKVDLVWTPR